MNSRPSSDWEADNKASEIVTSSSNVPDLNLGKLPTDVLLKIFALCGPESWPNISLACRRFYEILGPDSFLWEQIARRLLIVNQVSPAFCSK